MKMNWINHAGFIITHQAIVLACDPWIEDPIFNYSWNLISETKFQYSDFEKVTHIWFSHEHPDHFNPPNLKKIPLEIRQNITVLYQKTSDAKVIEFIAKLGFKEVIELPPSKWYYLSDDFKVLNQNDRAGDSWLAISDGKQTILNMNDVVTYTTPKALQVIEKNTGNIDVLMTQFSYASWAGNKNDSNFRKQLCEEKIQTLLLQATFFKPKFIIPFASYVWFCRKENFYANKDANKIEDIVSCISTQTTSAPVVLYPGDHWNVGELIDNSNAIDRYIHDRNTNISEQYITPSTSISFNELEILAKKFGEKQRRFHSNFMLSLKLKEAAKVFIEDLHIAVAFNLSGITVINETKETTDVILTSEHFGYCLQHNWGGDTLNVNGCFQVPTHGKLSRFTDYFYFSKQMNLGQKYTAKTAIRNIIRKLSS